MIRYDATYRSIFGNGMEYILHTQCLQERPPSNKIIHKRPYWRTMTLGRPHTLTEDHTQKTTHNNHPQKKTTLKSNHPQDTSLNRPLSRHITQLTTLKTHHSIVSTDHPQGSASSRKITHPWEKSVTSREIAHKIDQLKKDLSQDRRH